MSEKKRKKNQTNKENPPKQHNFNTQDQETGVAEEPGCPLKLQVVHGLQSH